MNLPSVATFTTYSPPEWSFDMGRNPQEDANRKAAREMHKAVDKVIDEKKKEPIGTKEAEEEVAADLNEAAHEDTKKDQRRR